MSINRLKALPSEVLLLVKLTQLKLAANKLESLPSLTALVKLKSVREVASAQSGALSVLLTYMLQLDVSDNALTEVPELPPGLQSLVAHGNRITKFPSHVLSDKLAELDLSNNSITALSDTDIRSSDSESKAEAVAGLTSLNLDGNGLSALPTAWSALALIKVLSLRHNSLHPQHLPQSLFEDTALESLRLEGNSQGTWTQTALQALPGFAAFEARRLRRAQKALHGGVEVDRTLCGITAK